MVSSKVRLKWGTPCEAEKPFPRGVGSGTSPKVLFFSFGAACNQRLSEIRYKEPPHRCVKKRLDRHMGSRHAL